MILIYLKSFPKLYLKPYPNACDIFNGEIISSQDDKLINNDLLTYGLEITNGKFNVLNEFKSNGYGRFKRFMLPKINLDEIQSFSNGEKNSLELVIQNLQSIPFNGVDLVLCEPQIRNGLELYENVRSFRKQTGILNIERVSENNIVKHAELGDVSEIYHLDAKFHK
jgi:hypothetical protein